MHSINFILISPRHVINKSYGEQPCAVKTLCISEKQPYAVGQPCAANTQRPYMSKKQPYAVGTQRPCLQLTGQPSQSFLCSE